MSRPEPPPRLRLADRQQSRLDVLIIDELVDPDHPVRTVWQWVQKLDLTPVIELIQARGSQPGRAATDPRILMCLWLYATLRGIGSARLLASLCVEYHPFRWIVGGVTINHRTLSEFRTANTEFLDQLLSNSMAALIKAGSVTLDSVAQDGMKVKANAGRSSFRKGETLQQLQQECRAQVEQLKKELEDNPEASTARQKSARQRAASERQERLNQALANMKKMESKAQQTREKQGKKPEAPPAKQSSQEQGSKAKKQAGPPRASTTDPESRRMKMANGGVDPAYNFQYVTDTKTRMVVGFLVTNAGTDHGLMKPLSDQLHKRYGRRAGQVLADAGYVDLGDVTRMEQSGTRVYMPQMRRGEDKAPPRRSRRRDTPETLRWRSRMESDEGKEILKERGSVAEWVNAQVRNHGLRQLPVRGLDKARAIGLWHALAHNLDRMGKLKLVV